MTKALQPTLMFFAGAVLLLLAAMLVQMAGAIPTTTTITTTLALDSILERSHAVERHGEQAIRARRAIFDCGVGLRVYFSPRRGTYLLICPLEESRRMFCAGMVVGARTLSDGYSHPEITSFIPLCAYWDGVVIRDGYLVP